MSAKSKSSGTNDCFTANISATWKDGVVKKKQWFFSDQQHSTVQKFESGLHNGSSHLAISQRYNSTMLQSSMWTH